MSRRTRPSRATPPARRPRWGVPRPAVWVPALVATLVFLPTLRCGFVWDDHYLIEHRLPQVTAAELPKLLGSDFWMLAGGSTGFWRPVIGASYWLDGRLSGFRPGWFHLVNTLAHALTTACLADFLLALGLPALAVMVAGLWFATLPAHVEAVAWISGRTDVLSTLFFLLALALDRRARARGGAWPGVPAVLAFALALLAKESTVLFVPILAAVEWARAPAARPAAIARWLAPYAAVTVAYLAAHAALVPVPGPPGGMTLEALAEVRRAAWTAFARSLAFLWPGYPHGPELVLETAGGTPAPAVAAGIAAHLVAAGACAAWLARRSIRAAPLLLLWLPALAPLAGMLARGEALYAERLFYLSSAGVAWALALGLAAAAAHPGARRVALGAAAALIVAGIAATWVQLPTWTDDAALYRSMTERSPRSARGHIGLADVLAEQGRDREAAAEYDRAERLRPWLPYVHVGRALLAFRRARWDEMLEESDRALVLDSLDVNARLLRATAQLRLRQPQEALATLATARALRPGFPPLEGAWGQALLQLDRTAEALPYLESANRWITDDADLALALATAYARERRFPEARAAYQRVVAIAPGFYQAWLRLATACHILGDAAGRDQALARAAALPQARDGSVEALRRSFETGGR